MAEVHWIGLTSHQKSILLHALTMLREKHRVSRSRVDALTVKLAQSDPYPKITVGIRGGRVERIEGNPFPVRVLDYDNDYCDAPDVDEQGRKCWCSIEPSDKRLPRIKRWR